MKKRITIRGSFLGSAGSVCLVLSALSVGLAQTGEPAITRSMVRVTQLKPDMASEWLTIQKNEVNPALKKAGIASRTVLENVIGNVYEYVSITPLDHYSALDGDNPLVKGLGKEAGARLQAKLAKCVEGQYVFISTRVEELTSVPKSPAAVWVSARYRVAPGKAQEYENFFKAEILPVYAKAKAAEKIAGYSFSRRGLGASSRDRVTIIYANKVADVEAGNPLTQILGQEAAAKIAAKGAGLATVVETLVRRRVPDLSY